MTNEEKRAELQEKVAAAQARNEERSFTDYARDAGDQATAFVKEHPIATVLGGVALGVLVAAVVPGPGRRMRKKASARSAVLAGALADLAVKYGSELLAGAEDVARSGKDRLGDLGDSVADGSRGLRRETGYFAGAVADSARALTRDTGKKAGRTIRDLKNRVTH